MRTVLERFRGPISQLPPMYSAISIGGKRLYDLARQGIEVERERRPVTIHSLELTAAQPQENRYTIEVKLLEGDLYQNPLRRHRRSAGLWSDHDRPAPHLCCRFFAGGCFDPGAGAAALPNRGALRERMLPIERVFSSLPRLHLGGKQEQMYRNGVRLDLARLDGAQTLPAGRGTWLSLEKAASFWD